MIEKGILVAATLFHCPKLVCHNLRPIWGKLLSVSIIPLTINFKISKGKIIDKLTLLELKQKKI